MKNPETSASNPLEALRPVPPRDPQTAARTRAAYLSQARAVSISAPVRHTGWFDNIAAIFQIRKERNIMFGQIVAIVVAVVVLLGGGGTFTVFAAQDSLPGDTLYPLKTWSEDVYTGMLADPAKEMEVNLEFADRRVQEMAALGAEGITPPAGLAERLELHINNAFMLAAGLGDDQISPALERLRQQLEVQANLMQNLGMPANPDAAALLTRTRDMVQEHLRLVEECQGDATCFRDQVQLMVQERDRLHVTGTPGAGYGPGGDVTPGAGYGPGGEATPGAGYGPGGEATPGAGYGPGGEATPGAGYGPGPGLSGTPMPGGGYGPGGSGTPPAFGPGGPGSDGGAGGPGH